MRAAKEEEDRKVEGSNRSQMSEKMAKVTMSALVLLLALCLQASGQQRQGPKQNERWSRWQSDPDLDPEPTSGRLRPPAGPARQQRQSVQSEHHLVSDGAAEFHLRRQQMSRALQLQQANRGEGKSDKRASDDSSALTTRIALGHY